MNGQKLKFMPADPSKAPEKRRMRNTEKSNMGSTWRRCATTKTMKLTIATIRKLMTVKPEYRQVLKKKVKGEDGEISVDWINNDLITFVKDRLGHDQRYAIDPTKITNALGWYPETKFEDGIVKTIVWYLENQDWVEEVTSGDYQGYYEKMYGK